MKCGLILLCLIGATFGANLPSKLLHHRKLAKPLDGDRCRSTGGECHSYNECRRNGGEWDIRNDDCDYPGFCCKGLEPTEPTTTTTTQRTTRDPNATPPPPGECGIIPSSWIVGGVEANEHSWPWQVSLQKSYYGTLYHICGGTAIDKNHVITAAHCVDGGRASEYKIYAGVHAQDKKHQKGTAHTITKITMHPRYDGDGNGFPNDIAVLTLASEIEQTFETGYACLPRSGSHEFSPGDKCYITGWGDTKGTGDDNVLNELRIDVHTNEACAGMWGSSYINDGHICVGDGTKGACNGDSGGPLVCEHDDGNGQKRWYLAGATSWGRVGCQTRGYPSVYSRVSHFLDFINDNRQ